MSQGRFLSACQATAALGSRLRRKALITRLPHSHRYQLTPLGRRAAVLFTKAHAESLRPAWLSWTQRSRRTSSRAAHSLPPGVDWTSLSTTDGPSTYCGLNLTCSEAGVQDCPGVKD